MSTSYLRFMRPLPTHRWMGVFFLHSVLNSKHHDLLNMLLNWINHLLVIGGLAVKYVSKSNLTHGPIVRMHKKVFEMLASSRSGRKQEWIWSFYRPHFVHSLQNFTGHFQKSPVAYLQIWANFHPVQQITLGGEAARLAARLPDRWGHIFVNLSACNFAYNLKTFPWTAPI